jgi:hypothetical protein
VWEPKQIYGSVCGAFTWPNDGFKGNNRTLLPIPTLLDSASCFFAFGPPSTPNFFFLIFSLILGKRNDHKKINAILQLIFFSNLVPSLLISIHFILNNL